MNRLILAGFSRIRRDKLFWVCMIFMAGMAAYAVIINYFDQFNYLSKMYLDPIFFGCFLFTCVVVPIFCSLFFGTEYSDGTIRNKIIVGHTRASIYLSNLALTFLSGLLMCLIYIVSVSVVGISLGGTFSQIWNMSLFHLLVCGILMLAATASIYTFIAILCHNKAVSAVISVLLAVLLFIGIIVINEVIYATEFANVGILTPEGEMLMQEVPNLNYPSETKRAVYLFFNDLLPTGQAAQITNLSLENPWRPPLLSLLITLVTTAGGLLFFRKKDLK